MPKDGGDPLWVLGLAYAGSMFGCRQRNLLSGEESRYDPVLCAWEPDSAEPLQNCQPDLMQSTRQPDCRWSCAELFHHPESELNLDDNRIALILAKQLRPNLTWWIEGYINRKQRNSTSGQLSPIATNSSSSRPVNRLA